MHSFSGILSSSENSYKETYNYGINNLNFLRYTIKLTTIYNCVPLPLQAYTMYYEPLVLAVQQSFSCHNYSISESKQNSICYLKKGILSLLKIAY